MTVQLQQTDGSFVAMTDAQKQSTRDGLGITALLATKASLDVSNTYSASQSSAMVDLGTVTGAVTIDASAGNTQRMVLGGSVQIVTPTNPLSGQNLGLHLIQDGTGSHLITSWPSNFLWNLGTVPTLSTTANARDFVAATYDDISDAWICALTVKGAA